MNLIINKVTKNWHISTMETLGKNEIIIKNFDISKIELSNTPKYKVNDTLNGLIVDSAYMDIKYKRDRSLEYAKLNQDEMRFDDLENNTTIWQDAINAIKVKYPKPE